MVQKIIFCRCCPSGQPTFEEKDGKGRYWKRSNNPTRIIVLICHHREHWSFQRLITKIFPKYFPRSQNFSYLVPYLFHISIILVLLPIGIVPTINSLGIITELLFYLKGKSCRILQGEETFVWPRSWPYGSVYTA